MRHLAAFVLAAFLVVVAAAGVFASSGGGYLLDWFTVDGGGATHLEGGEYSFGGTSGQPEADPVYASGGNYRLKGGFWYGRAEVATIGGRVWQDLDKDSIMDEEETGLAGTTVRIEHEQVVLLAEESTDGEGFYSFDNLQPGTYIVRVVLPEGFSFVALGGDSAIIPATGTTLPIRVAAGEKSLAWHAGVFPSPTDDPPAEEPTWWEEALRIFLPAINR